MPRNYYSEINLHLVWHTKQSLPLLNPDVKKAAYAALESRIRATDGVYLHQVGGIENHVHLAVTIPPTLLISDWIGKLKGGSSHDVNQQSMNRDKQLQWQAGYGVVSFGKRDIPWVVQYIRNQRTHHSSGSLAARLEVIDQHDGG